MKVWKQSSKGRQYHPHRFEYIKYTIQLLDTPSTTLPDDHTSISPAHHVAQGPEELPDADIQGGVQGECFGVRVVSVFSDHWWYMTFPYRPCLVSKMLLFGISKLLTN